MCYVVATTTKGAAVIGTWIVIFGCIIALAGALIARRWNTFIILIGAAVVFYGLALAFTSDIDPSAGCHGPHYYLTTSGICVPVD